MKQAAEFRAERLRVVLSRWLLMMDEGEAVDFEGEDLDGGLTANRWQLCDEAVQLAAKWGALGASLGGAFLVPSTIFQTSNYQPIKTGLFVCFINRAGVAAITREF